MLRLEAYYICCTMPMDNIKLPLQHIRNVLTTCRMTSLCSTSSNTSTCQINFIVLEISTSFNDLLCMCVALQIKFIVLKTFCTTCRILCVCL